MPQAENQVGTIPAKLSSGDEIRIIAPSSSFAILQDYEINLAVERFEQLGLKLSFGQHIREMDALGTASIESRLADLHAAFSNPQIKAIFTAIGGFHCNQLLAEIDYALIQNNPKILCGFSDITGLANAIFCKTGLVTYSGAHFSTLGMKKGGEYTLDYLSKCLFQPQAFRVKPSDHWSDDAWYLDQENRSFHPQSGWLVLQEGQARGTIIGGNLSTFNLLHGTEFMPNLADKIVFIEDDYLVDGHQFDRYLQALLHQPGAKHIQALLIGRFQIASQISTDLLCHIINTKKLLRNIPIVANVNFGHVSPIFTFPIGGECELYADKQTTQLNILKH